MNQRSVNISQFRPTWLPKWNWLDGEENCLLAASPASVKGKGEKFCGKRLVYTVARLSLFPS